MCEKATLLIERGLQHYRSAVNGHALLAAFRADPRDLHLLRVGMGGLTGVMGNIDGSTGAPSMAFHSDPAALHWDAWSGDYGVSFQFAARAHGAYVVLDPQLGWLCYLCDFRGASGAGGAADAASLEPPAGDDDAGWPWFPETPVASGTQGTSQDTQRWSSMELVPRDAFRRRLQRRGVSSTTGTTRASEVA